jgi:hypothetical protein
MKSVALVGFYDPTLHHVQQSQADELWLFNHGAMLMVPKTVPRCDRLFEIHKEDWFRRKELPAHEEYWEWLTGPHSFPIYLQDPIPEIPAGIVYPYEAVCADIFAHLLRKGIDGREVQDTYLTCSASFALALAITEGYKRVELYGIGMETDTEYSYQLPGFTYMIGVANGRGIDVVNMPETPVCRAEVYAYTAIPYVTHERLLELTELYQLQYNFQAAAARQVIAEHNSGKHINQAAAQAASDLAAAYSGAIAALGVLADDESAYYSRQALEIKRRKFVQDCDLHKAETNASAGQYVELVKRGRRKEAGEVWKRYLNARASMHANSGAVQLIDNLIEECDLKKPEHVIVLTIQDA